MASDLTAKLYQAINEADKPREIKHWHASSIAKCPRALYFERKGVPGLPENEPGGGKKLRWRGGHAVEAAIRPELEKIYPGLQTNIRMTNPKIDLTGEFDGYDPVSETLISVKSTHDFAFISREGRTGLKKDTGERNARGNKIYTFNENPYISHEWQEASYVILSDNENFEIKEIVYIYITLGGLIDTFRTPVKPEIVKRVSDKLEYLNKCWADSTLPICLCQPGKEMFDVTDQYCDYRTDILGVCCSPKLVEALKK